MSFDSGKVYNIFKRKHTIFYSSLINMIKLSDIYQCRENMGQIQVSKYLRNRIKLQKKWNLQLQKAETSCLENLYQGAREILQYQALINQQDKKIHQLVCKCQQLTQKLSIFRPEKLQSQVKPENIYNRQRLQSLKANLQLQKVQNKKYQQKIQEIKRQTENHKEAYDKYDRLLIELESRKETFAKLQKIQNFYRTRQKMFQQRNLQLDQLKKVLNHQLQQVKGNIRVYCRIRPILADQQPINYNCCEDLIQIRKNQDQLKSNNFKKNFEFVVDHIFDQKSTQQDVFDEISQLVQSSVDGKNVCIFAYGQTGSGKTFTMQGKECSDQGIIPRSISLIHDEISKRQNQYSLGFAVFEIYNDNLINLSSPETKTNKISFSGVNKPQQLLIQFENGIKNRAKSFTKCNAQSSRSHLIFIIQIKSRSHSQSQQKVSHLVLVDLAGAERIKKSAVTDRELKQAQHINKSLTQLGSVIRSLKKGHKTNFRNSKLTFVLQPYLEKGSCALMLVNISPSSKDIQETINSLKFACIARQCVIQ